MPIYTIFRGMSKVLFLLTALIFLAELSHAQKLKGKVQTLNPQNKLEVLIGANVYWEGTIAGTTSDVNGQFKIDLIDDSNNLIVSYVGFVSDTIQYKGEKELTVTLKSVNALSGAEIVGQKKDTELSLTNPINIQTIGQGELCKAACCNLSESFETNASVDAAYTDAVTGTRQIRMLGLDGKYSQIMSDNIPSVRGLSTVYGLSYIPGPWIDKIYVSKGVGSVINGYESITGQINVGMKKATTADKFYANLFGSSDGRVETNAIVLLPVNDTWTSALLIHGEWADLKFDKNNDSFLDNPLKKDLVLRNNWNLHTHKGWSGDYSVGLLSSEQLAGQVDFEPNSEMINPLWGAEINALKADFDAKTGYILQNRAQSSFGSQISASYYDLESNIGEHTYTGIQKNLRANLLYSSYLGKEKHKYTTGISYNLDDYQEQFDSISIDRFESVPGAFIEYNYENLEKFAMILGIRGDYHNLFGFYASPRAHVRFSLNELASLKAVAGMGWRTPNVFIENMGYMASSRDWNLQGINSYGYRPEEATNLGLNYTQKFRLNHRDANFSMDLYHTRFQNQIVTDLDQSAKEIHTYNLQGESFSNSIQAEFFWEMNKRMEIRTAYRWLEVWTDYADTQRQVPFTSKNRAFLNLTYKTKEKKNGSKWLINSTVQWIGSQRIPFTGDKLEQNQLPDQSEDFLTINAQVNYYFNDRFDMYVGVENAGNYRQSNPIIDSENPFSDEFDASLVWAPVFGRMFYFGLNFRIPRPELAHDH